MKKILFVAKNELYSLFYSPIAWILMVLFLVMTSADYIGVTDFFLGMFERGGPGLMFCEDLTDNILANPMFGYLLSVIRNLYMFFPLITMGLISREVAGGTIRLLYSSPLRIREIVLGKYVAILVFTLCLIVLVGFTTTALSLSILNPDHGHILASLFGIFMVLATYAAIGLFISSLTSYQIVAAIITLGVFGLLSKIGDLWQEIDLIRDITYYMNIGGKSFNLIRALLNLRDIMYFVILISSFLAFTIIKLKSGTESISVLKKTLRYATVVIIALIAGYITQKPQVNVYLDATRYDIHTITPPTQAMLAKLDDGELEITAFANLLDGNFPRYVPSQQNSVNNNLWDGYIRFKPNIKLKYLYYYDTDSTSYHYKLNPGKSLEEIAELQAIANKMNIERFLTPKEVNKLVDIKDEEYRCFFVMKYKGKTAIVRTFDDNMYWPSENEIGATINRLIATPPMVSFLSDEIERGPYSERPRDYKMIASMAGFRYSLRNQGYDFDTVSLRQRDIPKGIAALVLADPRTPFTPEGLEKINRYIDEGGNLMITTEPDRRDIIKPVLDKLGIGINAGMLMEPTENYASNTIFPGITQTMKNIHPQFARFVKNEIKYYGDTVLRVGMTGASVMTYQEKDGFKIDPLMYTNATTAWNRTLPVNADSVQLKVERHSSDENGSFVTAVRMTRKVNNRNQQIFAFSDADFLSKTDMFGYKPKRYNFYIGFWCFSQFSEGQFPANTLRPESLDNGFKIKVSSIGFQKLILYWIIPGIIVVIASLILIRRKRK